MYGYFSSRFDVVQDEIEPEDTQFASCLRITVPVAFSEEFFEWFDYRRWEKVKSLFKEIKRRRGSGNAICIDITFQGNRSIMFRIDSDDKQWFDNSVEKLDFVLELLPYHMDKLPPATVLVKYTFDVRSVRWRLHTVRTNDRYYRFLGDRWVPKDDT